MLLSPSRVWLVAAVAVALVVVWYYDRGRWLDRASDRLVSGVPWGTLIIVAINVAFYLFAQTGLTAFGDPVVYAFVSWSYSYPLGILTAGIAHGSPAHILGNMTATLAVGTVAEYAWGHYPPSTWRDRWGGAAGRLDAGHGGWLSRPGIRILAFVGIMLVGAVVTSIFSLGPGIGFSGVVFGIAGFAVVLAPLAGVVAVVASSAIGQLVTALRQPVVRAGIEASPPAPPAWAGIGFQVHMLGFLLGVLLAVGVLVARDQRRSLERVFFGTALFGLALSLWLVVLPGGGDTFVLYRAVGVGFVVVLALLTAAAAGASAAALPRPLSVLRRAPTRTQLAYAWFVVLWLGLAAAAGAALLTDALSVGLVIPLLILAVLLAVPALPPVLPDEWVDYVSRRQAAGATIAVLAVLVGLVAVPYGFVVVDGDTLADDGSVSVRDYQIAYVENGTSGHSLPGDVAGDALQSEVSGVVVVSDQREIWTVAVREGSLAYDGTASVTVGGVGWRETVEVERNGWAVVGNDSAYVVDLTVDGERTRSFTSAPVEADVTVDGYTAAVAPTDEGFRLQVDRNGTQVGAAPIPDPGSSVTIESVAFSTVENGGDVFVVARSDGTRVRIATRS